MRSLFNVHTVTTGIEYDDAELTESLITTDRWAG